MGRCGWRLARAAAVGSVVRVDLRPPSDASRTCPPRTPRPHADQSTNTTRAYSRPLGRGEEEGGGVLAPQRSALLADERGGGGGGGNSLGDEWVYLDPQGVVQGPFCKQDIIEWCAHVGPGCMPSRLRLLLPAPHQHSCAHRAPPCTCQARGQVLPARPQDSPRQGASGRALQDAGSHAAHLVGALCAPRLWRGPRGRPRASAARRARAVLQRPASAAAAAA